MTITYEILNNCPRLYEYICPIITSRAVIKEFGNYPIFTGDNKTWILAFDGDKCIGFSNFLVNSKHIIFGESWVNPAHRRKGVYSELFKRRLSIIPPTTLIKVLASDASLPVLEKHNFKKTGAKGKWTLLELNWSAPKELAA